MTFGNKRTHCESSNPPFVGADSAVKLWDDLALPSSRESRGWSALLAARCPGRGSLLPTGCAGQVRAPSPAPALRDSGHQAPAKAGSVLPAGLRRHRPHRAGHPRAREASADGTRDMPQMEFLQRSVVTSVHFGVAALTAPGSALAGTARRELRALGMRDAVLTELLPLAGRGGAPVGAVGTGERSRVLTHQGTQLIALSASFQRAHTAH